MTNGEWSGTAQAMVAIFKANTASQIETKRHKSFVIHIMRITHIDHSCFCHVADRGRFCFGSVLWLGSTLQN